MKAMSVINISTFSLRSEMDHDKCTRGFFELNSGAAPFSSLGV